MKQWFLDMAKYVCSARPALHAPRINGYWIDVADPTGFCILTADNKAQTVIIINLLYNTVRCFENGEFICEYK